MITALIYPWSTQYFVCGMFSGTFSLGESPCLTKSHRNFIIFSTNWFRLMALPLQSVHPNKAAHTSQLTNTTVFKFDPILPTWKATVKTTQDTPNNGCFICKVYSCLSSVIFAFRHQFGAQWWGRCLVLTSIILPWTCLFVGWQSKFFFCIDVNSQQFSNAFLLSMKSKKLTSIFPQQMCDGEWDYVTNAQTQHTRSMRGNQSIPKLSSSCEIRNTNFKIFPLKQADERNRVFPTILIHSTALWPETIFKFSVLVQFCRLCSRQRNGVSAKFCNCGKINFAVLAVTAEEIGFCRSKRCSFHRRKQSQHVRACVSSERTLWRKQWQTTMQPSCDWTSQNDLSVKLRIRSSAPIPVACPQTPTFNEGYAGHLRKWPGVRGKRMRPK